MTMATFGARDQPLAPHTSLRIGGPADFFLRVASQKDLLDAIQVARENELPVFLLGGGTKKRQQRDIASAQAHWQDYKTRKRRN